MNPQEHVQNLQTMHDLREYAKARLESAQHNYDKRIAAYGTDTREGAYLRVVNTWRDVLSCRSIAKAKAKAMEALAQGY